MARGWVDRNRVETAVRALGELRLVYHAHSILRPRVWSLRDAFSAHDATYVALAEALEARLVTADRAFARGAAELVEIVDVSG